MLGNLLIFLFILFLIIVILPLSAVFFFKISKKVIQKKLENGQSIFEASFKYSYKANFIVWMLIFSLAYFGTDINKSESLKFILTIFLIIYFIGTTLTTLTSGLLISYIAKQSLNRKNNIVVDNYNKVKEKTIIKDYETLTSQKKPNNFILEEKSILYNIKNHIDSPSGVYFSMILIIIYGLIYRFIFEGYPNFLMFTLIYIIPFIIVIIPAILQQKEMEKSISKQFFYPIICITLFFLIGIVRKFEDLLIISVFMYFPFSIFTGLSSIFIFFVKKRSNN